MKNKIALAVITALSFTAYANSPAETKSNEIESLKREVAQLKRDLRQVISNQQAIAEHTGLLKKNTQQAIQIGGSATIGKDDAEVVIIEFTDLHCPFCKKFNNETLPLIKEKFIDSGEAFFVGKNYPITALHKNAYTAAQALECSRGQKLGDEKHYIQSKNWLFDQGSRLYEKELELFANAMSLDKETFDACIQTGKPNSAIDADMKLVKQLGISSTPAFVVGLREGTTVTKWKTFTGAKSVENFATAIEAVKSQKQ